MKNVLFWSWKPFFWRFSVGFGLGHIGKSLTDDSAKSITRANIRLSTWLCQLRARRCFSVRHYEDTRESRILWRVSLLVSTATTEHPNPQQPSTGLKLNGESTSSYRSQPSLTNFFRPVNGPTWPVQSLDMLPAVYSGQATPAHSTFLAPSLYQANAVSVPQLHPFGIAYRLISETLSQFNCFAIN